MAVEKTKIREKEVIGDILAGLSDAALMKKYGLSPKGLRRLYVKLIDMGAVTQRILDSRKLHAASGLCPACGTKTDRLFKFCGECGLQLAVACSSCGSLVGSTHKFCTECGRAMQPAAAEGNDNARTEPSHFKDESTLVKDVSEPDVSPGSPARSEPPPFFFWVSAGATPYDK